MRITNSIVVCTYNRRALLEKCLRHLVPQVLASSGTEVLIVDDGSTDETRSLMTVFPEHARVRWIAQPNRGNSAARNTGFQAAQGHWVTFLDDDAWPPEGWVSRLEQTSANAGDDVAAIGGPVLLDWKQPKPLWLEQRLLIYLTHFEPSPTRTSSAENPLFVGANMTLRRADLVSTGGFSEALGRKKTNLLSRDDSAIWENVRKFGRCAYEPNLSVFHVVQAERLSKRWFIRRFLWEGVSWQIAASEGPIPPWSRRLVRSARQIGAVFAAGGPLSTWLRSKGESARLNCLGAIAYDVGRAWVILRGHDRF